MSEFRIWEPNVTFGAPDFQFGLSLARLGSFEYHLGQA